ncbi:MAG: hypothetical protein ACYC5K_10460 [Saccharofermentanales bacterium]
MAAILKNLKLRASSEMHNSQRDGSQHPEEKQENPTFRKENEKRYESTKNYFYFNQMIK